MKLHLIVASSSKYFVFPGRVLSPVFQMLVTGKPLAVLFVERTRQCATICHMTVGKSGPLRVHGPLIIRSPVQRLAAVFG